MAIFDQLSVDQGSGSPFKETADGNLLNGDTTPYMDAVEPASAYYSLAATAEYNKSNLPDKATLAMNDAAFGQ